MHLLITRPEEDARATAEKLEALGHTVTIAPMLEIVADPDAVLDVAGAQAVAVTSPRAVAALAARPDFPALAGLPLFAVGDRTARAAGEAGFAAVESAAGAVEDLAGLMARRLDPSAGAIVYACGRDRRGDLEGRLETAGFQVRMAEVYRAEVAGSLPGVARDALAQGQIDAVLVYSPRTAAALVQAMTKAGLRGTVQGLTVFAISQAAAVPLCEAGASRVEIAARPDEAALLDRVARER